METHDNGLEELYEKSIQYIQTGSIMKGKVVAKLQDSIVVDIGYKSEGFIPIEEFTEEELSTIKEGDGLDVFVSRLSDSDGCVSLSKVKARKIKALEELQEIHNEEKEVKGKITEKIKGGFYVDILGLKAFLPGSQAELQWARGRDRKPDRDLYHSRSRAGSRL